MLVLFVCFVALGSKSTAMVMAGRSVHLAFKIYCQDKLECLLFLVRTFTHLFILLDFLFTVKAAPNECVIRTGQP